MKKISLNKYLPVLLLVWLCVPVARLSAQDSVLVDILAELKTAAAQTETLQGSFVQEKTLQMFDQLLVSQGALVFRKPDQLRWELLTPVASGFVLRGSDGVRWNSVSQQVQRFSVATDPVMGLVAQQLLAWARVDLEWLGRRYRMEVLQREPIVLRLIPLDPAEADFVEQLQVAFAPVQGYVREVLVVERQGDSTRLIFNEIELNNRVTEEAFLPPEF